MSEEWDKVVGDCHINSQARHEAQSLMIDSTKARCKLGWNPVWNIKKTVQYTMEWYRTYFEENFVITDKQIKKYLTEAKENKSIWACQ